MNARLFTQAGQSRLVIVETATKGVAVPVIAEHDGGGIAHFPAQDIEWTVFYLSQNFPPPVEELQKDLVDAGFDVQVFALEAVQQG